jgi:hypothetical protein
VALTATARGLRSPGTGARTHQEAPYHAITSARVRSEQGWLGMPIATRCTTDRNGHLGTSTKGSQDVPSRPERSCEYSASRSNRARTGAGNRDPRPGPANPERLSDVMVARDGCPQVDGATLRLKAQREMSRFAVLFLQRPRQDSNLRPTA